MRQVLNRRNRLLHFDLLVLLLLRLGRQALPRQTSLDKVHEDHADLLEIIPSRLLYAHMRIQTSIPCRARQLFIVFIADVATRPRVLVSLGQAEVDHVDYMLVVPDAYQEVVGLDVSV